MRKKRENNQNTANENIGSVSDNKSGYVKDPPKWDSAQIKSFKEKDIEILNYLDSIGEGIYDEDRTPGMYLKRHRGELSDRVKKRMNSTREGNQEESENSEAVLKELFGNLKKSTENDTTES